MRRRVLPVALALSLAANAFILIATHQRTVAPAHADVTAGGEELARYMGDAQRLTHKLGLAVQAKNKPLAEFYQTEIGETFASIQKKFPQYEGLQIAALSKAMLDPAQPALAKALAASNWTAATSAYAGFVNACNTCHVATNHAFVQVTVPAGNPFNQSFSPK